MNFNTDNEEGENKELSDYDNEESEEESNNESEEESYAEIIDLKQEKNNFNLLNDISNNSTN